MTDVTKLTNAELADEIITQATDYWYSGCEVSLNLREAARRLRALDEPVHCHAIAKNIARALGRKPKYKQYRRFLMAVIFTLRELGYTVCD